MQIADQLIERCREAFERLTARNGTFPEISELFTRSGVKFI
jgi:hypothetical protein